MQPELRRGIDMFDYTLKRTGAEVTARSAKLHSLVLELTMHASCGEFESLHTTPSKDRINADALGCTTTELSTFSNHLVRPVSRYKYRRCIKKSAEVVGMMRDIFRVLEHLILVLVL